jgi:hypothetical protein
MQKVFFKKGINQQIIQDNIMNEAEGEKKFNTCKFKSEELQTKKIKRCSCQGGNYTVSGYSCTKRDIFNIDKYVCLYCIDFEKK